MTSNRYIGNLAPMAGVFPDYKAPIVRTGAGGRELATARWGMAFRGPDRKASQSYGQARRSKEPEQRHVGGR